jgi:pantoate--beta-alanine ligase
MLIIKSAKECLDFIEAKKSSHHKIGFAPTMGALHQGHISLIEKSKQENDVSVCSIFVNPTQFNDPKDFEKYPITLEEDISKLIAAGCDVLFLPSVQEIYPDGTQQLPFYDLGFIETVLEGAHRPGHFQGVCQVVHRLLTLVPAHNLYMGQKDYQQCMVVRKLLEITNLQNNIALHVCPTLREPDGLAMSSRNMRLARAERVNAIFIYKQLKYLQQNITKQSIPTLIEYCTKNLDAQGFKVDYVSLSHAYSLAPINSFDKEIPTVALIAAFCGNIRLIDNLVIN